MYVCMYVLYAYILVCMHRCVYACMYICMHACIHVCIYVIFKLGFERYGEGIVLVGRGNCPGEVSGGEEMSVPLRCHWWRSSVRVCLFLLSGISS